MAKKLYQEIASTINSIENCIKIKNNLALAMWKDRIEKLNNCLPSGSGIDSACKIDESSTSQKIIIVFSYHFMNDGGYYDGWEDYTLVLTPSFIHGFSMKIKGKNKDGIKEYFYDIFEQYLNKDSE